MITAKIDKNIINSSSNVLNVFSEDDPVVLLSNAVEIVFSSTLDAVGWVYISDGNEELELFSFSPGVVPWEVEIGRDIGDAIKANKIVKSDNQFHGKLDNRGRRG